MSICDLVLTFIKMDTGALYKKLSSKHDSCSKYQLSAVIRININFYPYSP